MPKKLKATWIAAAAIGVMIFTTAGACDTATSDRTGGAGKEPDFPNESTWNVQVFANADSTPNVVLFCVNRKDPIAVMSTLSGGDAGENKAAQIVKMPELNASYCGGRAQ